MKKIVILLVLLTAFAVSAQEQETLIKGGIESGGFGAPSIKFTSINDEFGIFLGGYGGWLINHQFLIGGGGYGLVTKHNAAPIVESTLNNGNDLYLHMGYGGLVLGYFFTPEKIFHICTSLLVGAGGAGYSRNYGMDDNNYDNDRMTTDGFFVLEPTIQGELNVTTFFRIGVGISYRYISGTNLMNISNSELSGPSAVLDLKFGKF
ncbi:MAG: hypothetical protein ACM3O3_11335 [Syntrophothermus sp.]